MKKIIFIATMIAILGSMSNKAYAATQIIYVETIIYGKYVTTLGTGVKVCYEDEEASECLIIIKSYEFIDNVIDYSSLRTALFDQIPDATASTLSATIDIAPNYTSEFDPEIGSTIYKFGIKPTSRVTTESEAWDWLLRVIE